GGVEEKRTVCHQLVAAVTRALLPVVEPSYRWRIAGLGDVYAVYRKTYDNVWNIDGGGGGNGNGVGRKTRKH
ncbi:Uncharacterized protein APZ42_002728, partial [Daphnia magna]